MPVKLGASLVAEFVGTFALCFVGILAIHHSGGNLLLVALAHGLILATMISATLQTSGGQFNPAVTASLMVTGKIKLLDGLAYIFIQLLAGTVAAVACLALYGAKTVYEGTPAFDPEKVSVGQALLAEGIVTFFLVFAVWGTAADPRARNVGGFAIGLTVAANILAVGPLTGASMNPARSFGPTLVAALDPSFSRWSQHWVYWVAPLAGGILAGAVYHVVLWPRDKRGNEPGTANVPPAVRP